VLGQAGISNDKCIIIYDSCGLLGASRLWWMLQSFGFQNAKILNGGLQQWRQDDLPLESGEIKRPPAQFKVQGPDGRIVDMTQTWDAVREGRQIADARSERRFRGLDKEPRPGVRSGHIPGS